ncbi:MAG: tripartite tricarboxylate transporter substrate-binding protein [Beijerinckiaceae bacterium]|nr:tripartite tricarboxylate transporter substrate-binding protein [Beijerinckiaceae bacterium]
MAYVAAASRTFFATSVCIAALISTANAEDKAYYQGKTVRMIVGSGPGGGYDVFSRMIAPYLAQVLGTIVVVENQPGAGGLTALNRLYAAPPDGYLLSLSNGTGAAFAQITGRKGVRFDLAKFSYLATVGAPPALWMVAPESPIKTVQQALATQQKWRWAASGSTSGLATGAAFACEALKMQCQIVAGYTGSNQAALAVTRGEMDAINLPESSANHFQRTKQNFAIATMGRTKSRFFPDQPTIFDAVKLSADAEWLFDFYDNVSNLGRILVAAPNMPAPRLAYLQAAVKETLANPQLIAEGEKAERIIEYLGPDETLANAKKVVSEVTPEQKARIIKILESAGSD